jgi:putative ABC transport system permease protein
VEGEPAPPPERTVVADYRTVSPGYFETMQIPLLRGRRFDERDQIGSGPVVIVDQTLAERYWPDANPIGKRIQLRRSANPNVPWFEIIGIVGHVKGSGIKENWRMQVYRPLLQKASSSWGSIVIRTVADPKDFIATVRNAVYQIDHEQLVCDPRTMEDILWWRFITNRAITSFLTVFACIALCLSAAGIYAITRYSVTRRTQEFGLRMALGASRSNVLRLVLRNSLIPVQVGAGIGLVGTVAVAQVLSSLLYQISPWDPMTYVAVCVLLAGVAVLASYLPARRAAKIDPMGALRYE